MKLLSGLVWTGAALLLLAAVGCKGGSGKPRVAFVSNNPENFWKIAEAGAKKAGDDFGVEVLFRMPSPGNEATQKEVIDTVLGQGVKAIAVSVIDPKNQGDTLDEIAAKVKLLTVDNDAPKTKRLAYIGTDNYQAGRAAGKLVKEAMPDGGTVVIFVGRLDSLNARQRRQGVIDELAGAKPPADLVDFELTKDGITVGGKYKLHKETYLDQPEGSSRAFDNAVAALAAIPESEHICMVGLWAYNPPKCLAAVTDKVKDEARRKRIRIVGFDEDYVTLDGVKEGSIYGTVVQNPYEFGYQSVKAMAALVKGDQSAIKEKMNYIPYRIITKEEGDRDGLKRISVDVFRPELEKLMGKQK